MLQSFPHDSHEQFHGICIMHHEKLCQKDVLPAAIVHQCILLTPKENFKGILKNV